MHGHSRPTVWVAPDALAEAPALVRALQPNFIINQLDAPELADRLLELCPSQLPDLLVLRWRDELDSLLASLRQRWGTMLPILAIVANDRELSAALLAGATDAMLGARGADELSVRARARARRSGAQPEQELDCESALYALFMQAPAAVAIVSGPEFVFELANPIYEQITGGRDLVGKPYCAAYSELTDDDPILRLLTRVYTTGEPCVEVEYRVALAPHDDDQRHGDRGGMFYQLTSLPIDEDGRVVAIATIGVDITDKVRTRRRFEHLAAQSRQNEQQFRTLANNAPDIIARFDRQERYLFVNKAAERATGIPVERFVGATNFELGLPPEIAAPFHHAIERVFQDRRPLDVEIRVPGPRGMGQFESRMVPELGPDGQVHSVLVISRDISEREQAKLALAENERRFRATFDNAAVGIALVDIDGRFLHLNDRFVAIVGYEREELLAKTFQDITHPDDVSRDIERLCAILHGPSRSFSLEKRYIRKDGSLVWANVTGSLIYSDKGAPEYGVAIVEDIDARKAIEAALRESDRQKDDFLATLGHELRNPIAAIHSATDLLGLETARRDAALRRLQTVLARQSSHIARLLDDLLDVSRISRGKLLVSRTSINVVDVLHNVLEDRRYQLVQRGLEARVDLPDEPLWVEGDAVRLAQVFDNLLSNAIKYTDPGGIVTIRAQAEGEHIRVRIIDTGIGIDAEFQRRLFQPFQQAPQGIARSAGGLGLGLAITKGIVELHGGTIEVYSAGRNRGTEFVVRIPRRHPRHPDVD